MGNGITVTCSSFGVGTGTVDFSTGTADVELSPEGTVIKTTDITSLRGNGSGWRNYIGIALEFDQAILPKDYFYGADLDAKEQMSIIGYNALNEVWILPTDLVPGSPPDQSVIDESVEIGFPLPPNAPSLESISIPTVNTDFGGNLSADDITSHFYVDFGNLPVTHLFFLYAKNDDLSTNGIRSVFAANDFDILEQAPLADLSLNKSASSLSVNPGDTVVFSISVINHGPDNASNILINDMLPDGYIYHYSNSGIGDYDVNTGIWSIDSLHHSDTILLEIVTTALLTGSHQNFAEIGASDINDPDSSPHSSFNEDDLNDGITDDDEDSVTVFVNSPPIALPDIIETDSDLTVLINVSSNDLDPDGNVDLSSYNSACTLCVYPQHGTLVNQGNGTFNYIPDPGYSGVDSFIYEVCDQMALCDTAWVIITVNQADDCSTNCIASFSTQGVCAGDITEFDGSMSIACSNSSIVQYTWNLGDGNSSDGPDPAHLYTTPGDYIVSLTITTDSGCIDTTSQIVSILELPVVDISPLDDVCSNQSIILSGGQPIGGSYSGPGIAGSTFNAATAGIGTHSIHYTFTDNNGCSGVDSTTITVVNAPEAFLDPIGPFCISDGPSPVPTGIPAGGYYSGNGQTNDSIYPSLLGSGEFHIDYIFSDASNCTDTARVYFEVLDWNRDSLYATICDDGTYILPGGETVSSAGTYMDTLEIPGQCGEIYFTILTEVDSYFDTLYIYCQDTLNSQPENSENLEVSSIIVENISSGGCDSIIVYHIYSSQEVCPDYCELFVPSAFTPDSDGLNDMFTAISRCPDLLNAYDLTIYNRWGESIFHSGNIDQKWDGTFKDSPMPMDVYTYIIRYSHGMEENIRFGNLTLIR